MRQILKRVLDRMRAGGPSALCIFDLDGTLLDNRPRQARIVREFGAARNMPALLRAKPEHWTTWSMKDAMRRMGVDDATAEAIYPEARAFWALRFFTSEYCVEDQPVSGAAMFVRSVAQLGGQPTYVTGRPEQMRRGTLAVFQQHGFPMPGPRVHLLMKPSLQMHDDAWKVQVQSDLRSLGKVVAAFDNEPTHVNTYREAFPDALVVRLLTEHSGRVVTLREGIESIPHF